LKIIGLTGGIGSGKSTVSRFLAELGAAVVDLDKVGHEILKSGGPAYGEVVSAFGKEILGLDGEIDRSKLGAIVFKDPKELRRLTDITHPAIDRIVAGKLESFRARGIKVAVLEAAAMMESGKTSQVDEVWVTIAPEEVRLRRIMGRGGLSECEAGARIRAQLSNTERNQRADVIIDTDCTLDELKGRVKLEWDKLQERL
jgi:dephospho-CoA kinase